MKGWQKMAMVLILAAFMLALTTVLTSTASAESDTTLTVPPGQINGLKFEDINTNGVLDPGVDYPVSNWTIYLWSTDNGLPYNLLATTQTSACGVYCFDNIEPGTYIVSEELRS